MSQKQRLLEFYGNDVPSVLEIVNEVKSNIPNVISDLELALATNNITELNAKLHYHGPSFTYVCFENITELMHYLEVQCLSVQNVLAIEKDVEALEQELKNCEQKLNFLYSEISAEAA